jgi:hypothetical protein
MRLSLRVPTAAFLAMTTGPLVMGCSIINAPDDVNPGAGGSAATTEAGPSSTTDGSSSSGTGDGGAGPTSTSASGGGGAATVCDTPADCDPTECEDATCDDGVCNVTAKDVGTACGPEGDGACVAPGRCDGAGECVTPSTDGGPCSTCEGEPFTCVCRASVCEECGSFASVNPFAEAGLVGWELEGGWGLYTRFPRDRQAAEEVAIGKRVLGTDGNREHPYPGGADAEIGGSIEQSSATTPTVELPSTLTFRSWHEDEGGAVTGRDNKRIVARSGVLPEAVLVDCAAGIRADTAFCVASDLSQQRGADAWDTISIPLPANLATLPGTIEFSYDSVDADGGRERGWFIDLLDVAGRCGCSDNAECAFLDGPCSLGICDQATSACTVEPRSGSEGDACGTAGADACSVADACDAFGYCDARDRVDGTACSDCDAGECQACGDGVCIECTAAEKTFEEPLPVFGWTLGVGWGVRTNAPPSTNPQVNFGQSVFGTLGDEASVAESIETAFPETLTFRSWHVDGGGTDGEGNKTITLVTDAGDEVVILDCAGGVNDDAAPCLERVGPRIADDFDDVSLPAGEAAGAVGTILFGYEADAPPAYAQGWFIDDLNAVRCP